MSFLITVVSFLLVMGILVFVHELGHFVAAKRSKIVVEEFGFGYPPRLLKLFERDGTIYSINAIPFGGFVRMLGEDDPTQTGSFAAASRLARVATLLAGPFMNFALAIILFAALALNQGVPDDRHPGAVVTSVEAGSPAAQAGLQPADRIVAVNDQPIISLDDLRKYTAVQLDQATVYRYVRGDGATPQTLEVTMIPRSNPPEGQGALGIGIRQAIRSANVFEAAWLGVKQTASIISLTFSVPATLIREGRPIGEAGFMGPVGIAVTTGDVVQTAIGERSIAMVLGFMGLLSAALGITNLLPLPALDGGRLLFVVIEAIRGRRIEPAREGMVHLIGFGLLLLLVGLLTVREIASLINGTFPSIGG